MRGVLRRRSLPSRPRETGSGRQRVVGDPTDTARRRRSRSREAGRCTPSSTSPDEHARSRREDRAPAPHRSRRKASSHRRLPRRRRAPRTRHPKIRYLDPRRILISTREQGAQERHVPFRIRRAPRPPSSTPTTTARSGSANATTRLSLPWPEAAPQCGAMAPSANIQWIALRRNRLRG